MMKAKPATRRHKSARRLYLEQLESRELLAVDYGITALEASRVGDPFAAIQVNYPALNLAKFQATSASSTSSSVWADEATDGIVSNDSRWYPTGSGPHWLEVQLAAEYPVGSAQLFMGLDDSLAVSEFEVQYHDGSDWQTAADVSGNTATDVNLVFTSPVTASRFRFYTPLSSGRIKEFALYPPNGGNGFPLGTDLQLNLAAQRGPTASGVFQDNHAIHGVDGWVHDDSRWLAPNSSGPHTFDIEIPSIHAIGSLHLYSGFDSGGSTVSPLSDFSIEYASGTGWMPISGGEPSSGSMSGNVVSGNTSEELVVNFAQPVLANKLRITFASAYGRIRELVVLPANVTDDGSVGYPIGTSVEVAAKPDASFADYSDGWYRLAARSNNNSLITDATGSSQATAETTDAEKRFQVLYSYATDSYRLRNQDTGLVAEVANASMLAGAAIVEGDYSAAPHQRWQLEPTSDGYFQFVNVWTGMVLSTDGSSPAEVTQQPRDLSVDPADTQEWQPAFQDDYFKKGTGGWVGQYNTGWAYDWGRNDPNLGPNQFYAPMQHNGGWPNWGTLHRRYHDWNNDGKAAYLMGFNEPDRPDQANMSVSSAINLWPRLMAMDVPLLSPATSLGGEGWWLDPFMNQVDNLGYRSDFAGAHWYSGPSADNLLNYINTVQDRANGRKVWLTEFSVVDWSGGSGNWSEETNYNFILEFLWRAEAKGNLEKYALFLFSGGSPENPWTKSNPRSNFFSGGSLTPFGKAYAAWDGDKSITDDQPFVIHNRNARHRIRNDGTSEPTPSWIRREDDSVQWFVQDAGNGRKYITSAVDGVRLSYDGASIGFAPAGTTGSSVEWQIDREQYGWHNIIHTETGEFLRLVRENDANNAPVSQHFEMVSSTDAAGYTSTDWWFVKPYQPALPPPVPGDFDGDFSLGCQDINLLTSEIIAGTGNVAFDMDADGRLTTDDRDAWLNLVGAPLGDANLDTLVDNADFDIWTANRFSASTNYCDGDFNTDGVVDLSDLHIWNENKFAPMIPPNLEPAPGTTGTRIHLTEGREQNESSAETGMAGKGTIPTWSATSSHSFPESAYESNVRRINLRGSDRGGATKIAAEQLEIGIPVEKGLNLDDATQY